MKLPCFGHLSRCSPEALFISVPLEDNPSLCSSGSPLSHLSKPSAAAQRCLALRLTRRVQRPSARLPGRISFPQAFVSEYVLGQTCAGQLLRTNEGTSVCRDAPIFKTRNLDDSFFLNLIDAFLLLFIPEENKEIIVKIKNK